MHQGGDADGRNAWGMAFTRQCGRRIERRKKRETGGPLALDGRRLFGRHNNQITVDESGARGDEGEMRPGWSVWDGAVASVRPSN
jgi:hypothetical protein